MHAVLHDSYFVTQRGEQEGLRGRGGVRRKQPGMNELCLMWSFVSQ